jgi:hypothetical protein
MSDTPSFSTVSNTEKPSVMMQAQPDSPLDMLKKVIEKTVKRPNVYIEVPERPGVSICVSPNITQHQLKSWRKNAGDETKNGMDTIKFATSVIGHTTVGIAFNDEIVLDENGNQVTFASPEVLAMTSTTRPLPDCVLAFFGIEPHVEAAAVVIMEASGYGDSVDTVDPTKKPSES